MDDHGQLEYATARGNDYPGHEQTYRSFVTLTKTTRCADGVALSVNVRFGLAVMVTTALDVRSAVL